MTQDIKQLLLKDLCARLLYNVMVKITGDDEHYTLFAIHPNKDMVIIGLNMGDCYATSKVKIDNCLPFLRPMSSMTEEEKYDIKHKFLEEWQWATNWCIEVGRTDDNIDYLTMNQILQYLYSRNFDISGLIPLGLAIEAPEGMYKID